jgi:hypothetical protein
LTILSHLFTKGSDRIVNLFILDLFEEPGGFLPLLLTNKDNNNSQDIIEATCGWDTNDRVYIEDCIGDSIADE